MIYICLKTKIHTRLKEIIDQYFWKFNVFAILNISFRVLQFIVSQFGMSECEYDYPYKLHINCDDNDQRCYKDCENVTISNS